VTRIPLVALLLVLSAPPPLRAQDAPALQGGTANGNAAQPGGDEPAANHPADEPADDAEEALPKYTDMPLPAAEQLLQESPVDWVRLKTDEVIVVAPIYPRPDPLGHIQRRIDELARQRPRTDEERDRRREEREKLNYLHIILPGDEEAPEYRIETRRVQEIIHHEDLVLRRLDRLIADRNTKDAYSLLAHLERRAPKWQGILDRRNTLLFLEADIRRKAGKPEEALVYLEQLHDLQADFAGLTDALGEVVDELAAGAVTDGDFARGRHYLGRLNAVAPDHAVVRKWQADLQARTARLMADAEAARAGGRLPEAAEIIARAAVVWPQTAGLPKLFGEVTQRWQRLPVGVAELPGGSPEFFLTTQAERRREYLTHIKLFEISRFDERPRYRTRYFEQWQPTDLGRRIAFRLRSGAASWESRPPLTAPVIADAVQRRLDPQSPHYDERLADYVESFSIHSPLRFEIGLSRVPLRIESLFRFPPPSGPHDAGEFLSPRFVEAARTGEGVTYRRAVPQPDGLPANGYRVAEIVERRYADGDRAVQSFVRGDVLMLAPVRLGDVERFEAVGGYLVVPMGLPVTHVLQFNPRSAALRNRELRRSLDYALDRERILQETLLSGASLRHGRVVTAPFPSSHEGYDRKIEPRNQDLTLAVALRLAAKKALKADLPELKMVCDPDPRVIEAARAMIAEWQRTGVSVRLLNGTGQRVERDSEDWDIVYRTVRMPEPLTDLWPFVTLDDRVTVDSMRHLPDWLRREFLELDAAPDEKTATERLRRMHRLMWSEVQYLPLWEIDEFIAFRREVKGMPGDPVHAYQDVERWTIERSLPLQWP
jgi:hypothetical protein